MARLSMLALSMILAQAEKARDEPRDYKVAYWFERREPLFTARFQVYDMARGQYTPAVDRWLTTMKTRHPGHAAFVREYRVTQAGLADKILGELQVIGGPNLGYGIRDPSGLLGASHPRSIDFRAPGLVQPTNNGFNPIVNPARSSLGAGYLTPPGSAPFPIPYPRPHP